METSLERPVDQLINEYGESHQNPVNKLIHWVCVPAIVYSVVGLLWSLPVPVVFSDTSPILNWGTLFLMASVVYYFILSIPLALGMVAVIFGLVYLLNWSNGLSIPLWQISVAIFVLAWIVQFIGHHIEGKKPSFFKDVQFLMIGPLWLLSFVYKRLGIPY